MRTASMKEDLLDAKIIGALSAQKKGLIKSYLVRVLADENPGHIGARLEALVEQGQLEKGKVGEYRIAPKNSKAASSDKAIRSGLIRLAHQKPEFRKEILAVLKTAAEDNTVVLSPRYYKVITRALAGFEGEPAWNHVISYAKSNKPMEKEHVESVLEDIDFWLENWKYVSKASRWTAKEKQNLAKAKEVLNKALEGTAK